MASHTFNTQHRSFSNMKFINVLQMPSAFNQRFEYQHSSARLHTQIFVQAPVFSDYCTKAIPGTLLLPADCGTLDYSGRPCSGHKYQMGFVVTCVKKHYAASLQLKVLAHFCIETFPSPMSPTNVQRRGRGTVYS